MASGYVVISDFHHSELSVGDDDWKVSQTITQITPSISIGGWMHSSDEKVITSGAYGAILSLHENDKPANIKKMYDDNKINYKWIKVNDHLREDFSCHFPAIWDFMNANKKILVTCSMGTCRAPAAVAYFMLRRMHAKKDKPLKAQTSKMIDAIKSLRSCTKINFDFMNQIMAYEAQLMGISHVPVKEDIFTQAQTPSKVG